MNTVDLLKQEQTEREIERTNQGDSLMNTLNSEEYREFSQWREGRIRQEAREEAQREAQRVNIEADAAADAAALAVLERKGVSLKDCFGNSSNIRGRNVVAIAHSSDRGKPQDARTYPRLRRLASEQGLVR